MSRLIGGGKKIDYERVAVDEWLTGVIEVVEQDKNRLVKKRKKVTDEAGTESERWVEETVPSVRFRFKLDGYHYPHRSRWMRESTFGKSNLYSKYLKYLCPQFDCEDKVIDLDKLAGAKVKVMWENNGDYQNVSQIRGLDPALNIIASGTEIAAPADEPAPTDEPADEEVPF